jgi:Pyruvate/2-oxoacid:ferredoxin oxidoreductase delta subunit
MSEMSVYHQLADTIHAGASKFIPRIYEILLDEDAARVVLAASPPASCAELAETTGIAEDEVQRILDDAYKKGVVLKSRSDVPPKYYRVRDYRQLHDATVLDPDVSPEVVELWQGFNREEWPAVSAFIESILTEPVSRALVASTALDPDVELPPEHDVRVLIREAERIAVTKCSCRVIDGRCGQPLEVCIQLGRAADYAIDRGSGRELGADEALQMLADSEQAGLVHTIPRGREIIEICNCCGDCCAAWPANRAAWSKFVEPSPFWAVIDPDECIACEDCNERCPLDAISTDQDAEHSVVNTEMCVGCGVCAVACPSEAIAMELRA